MTYDDAVSLAERGKAVVLSVAGGFKRYGWFTLEPATGIVSVRLFQTTIALFYPDGRLWLNTGGYRTATTKEALNVLLAGRGQVWTTKGTLVYHPYNGDPIPFEDGMEIPA